MEDRRRLPGVPRSFADVDGDGVGNLRGVLSKVDHLVDLGIDCVWMSPFYESPMRDNGYDVSDHCAVDPVFGTLDDFDAVIAALHERGIRLIVDFVPNHVSSDHPWFVEAVSGPASDKRDWFIWADPAPDGGPPFNWTASFTKASAWELDEASGQYYLHLFLPELLPRRSPVLAYRRLHGDDERLVAVNFGDAPVDVPDLPGTVVVASDGTGVGHPFAGRLGPDEAVLLRP